MQKLSLLDLNRLSVDEFKNIPKTSLVLVLDNVRSALNVGAAFRTGDAFLVEKIVLCGITATPPHKEILKTAIGATESVDWIHYENTEDAIRDYKAQGYKIAAVEQAQGSTMLQHVKVAADEKLVVVFGNEVKGVEQSVMDMVDMCIEIPQFGTKHSFNIAVSMGIVLWGLVQHMRPDLLFDTTESKK